MDEHIREGQLYAQPYKNGRWEPVRVTLSKEELLVLKRDVVHEDTMANNDMVDQKQITLHRDQESILGINIMGGLDFKSPIKIHRLPEGTPAQLCGELAEGDVILEVNGVSMWGLSHDEAVKVIKQSGEEVTVHTARLRLREIDDQLSVDEQWIEMAAISLRTASISRYQTGTAILRPNSFEVMGESGKVCLQCDTAELNDWIGDITRNISRYSMEEVEQYNMNLPENGQMVRMGRVYEQLPSTIHAHVWQRKFLALKREHIEIHSTMPDSIEEWERPEKRYRLVEMTVKVLEGHTIPEQRANSLIITSGTGESHVISCETKENICEWTTAIHQTTVQAVQTVAQVTYSGRWRERDIEFVLDINEGFLLRDRSNASVLWKKPFSYLRQSSDDGHSKLKLKCAIKQSTITEIQDIELADLQLAICGIECFLAAKVAVLDPGFIQQQTDLVAY